MSGGVVITKKKASKKKERPCPLSFSDWIQCLIADQNQADYYYYSEEVSTLTKVVVQLTLIIMVIGFLALVFSTFPSSISTEIKVVAVLIVAGMIIYVVNWRLNRYIDDLSDLKKEMNCIKDEENIIIEDIIDGNLKNSNEIRKKYKKI